MSVIGRALERIAQPPADPIEAGRVVSVGHAEPATECRPVDPPAVSPEWAPYAELPEWELRYLAGNR